MTFPKGNEIRFSHDFSQCSGIPDGVDFEIVYIDNDTAKLTAPGYGGKPYGSGAIFIHKGLAPDCGIFEAML